MLTAGEAIFMKSPVAKTITINITTIIITICYPRSSAATWPVAAATGVDFLRRFETFDGVVYGGIDVKP